MVGVAGKSKGCGTCRRRKVKCDLREPFCKNCTRMGIECEGYRRFPIFLNRTAKGWDKRQPREEVQPQTALPHAVAGQSQEDSLHGSGSQWNTQAFSSAAQLTPNPPPGPAQIDQMISWFWGSYSTTSMVSVYKNTEPQWIYLSLQIASPQLTLKRSIAALAAVRFGRAYGDQDLVVKGRQHYGLALRDLQVSLRDPDMSATDEVLAAVDYCILYEFFESTEDSSNAWFDHVSGVGKLLEYQGTQRSWTPLRLALYENSRYLLMLKAVMTMQATVFGQKQWMEEPWANTTKSYEQRIYDQGFILAALSEKLRGLQNGPSKNGIGEVLSFGNRLMTAIAALDQERPMTAKELKQYARYGSFGGTQKTTRFELLKVKLTLWAIQLSTAQILRTTSQRVEPIVKTVPPESPLVSLCAGAKEWADLDHNDALSRQVLSAVKVIQKYDESLFAGSRLLCPILVVMAHWKERPGPELGQACEARAQLTDGKGMSFGNTLTKFGSNLK